MQNKKGFTLLELLVVVLIIGILAGIALPQYKMAVGKAKFATQKDNARVIKSAMDRYYLVQNVYTRDFENLDVELNGNLTDNNCKVSLPDSSSCSIGSSSIFCSRYIFGVFMEYSLGYRGANERKRTCITHSKNSEDTANRLCQQETGKATGDEYGTYISYTY